MTYLMNKLLIAIEQTATAAAVFVAYFKLQSFVNMPVIGSAHGMMPIVSYNLGANNKERMLQTYHSSILYAMIIMVVGAALTLIMPDKLLAIFNASPQMLEIGIPAFRIISVSFIFTAYSLITTSFFMACGKSMLSLIMGAVRQLVVLVPVAYLFGYTLGYHYV